MYIKEMYIGAFGAIHDRTFTLEPGVNLIEGANEAGKSTLCSFIKFIFFGLSARGKGESMTDRKRYIPFEENSVHGTMTVHYKERDYLIKRSLSMTGKTSAKDEYTITDLATGDTAFRGLSPDQAFLSMGEGLFLRTAYVPQIAGATVEGVEVTAAIENILSSAEEEIDSAKALKALDSARVCLMHKNSKGGKLYTAIEEREAVMAELTSVQGAGQSLAKLEDQLSHLKKSEQENTRLLEEAKQGLQRYEWAKLLIAFENAEKMQEYIDKLKEQRENIAGGTPPSSEDILALVRLSEGIKGGRAAYAAAEQIPTPPEPQDPLEQDGGEQAVSKRLRGISLRGKVLRFLSVLFILAAACGTALGAAHYFDFISLNTDLHLPLIGTTAACGVLGLTLLIFGITRSVKLRKALGRYGISSLSELPHRAHRARNNRLLYEKALSDRTARLVRLETEQSKKEAEAKKLCAAYGIEYTGPEALEDLTVRLTAVREKCSAMDSKIAGEESALSQVMSTLSAFKPSEIADALGEDPHTVIESLDVKELKSRKTFGSASSENLRNKIRELEEARYNLREAARREGDLTEAKSRLSAEIDSMSVRLNALKLAYERMEKAADTVKEQVSPVLAKRAGELLCLATGGKYDRLFIGHDMSLTYLDKKNGNCARDAHYLSKGTRDLAYIALRIALCELLSADNPLPMIFDESFAAMDDNRLSSVYRLIVERGAQSVILTSQNRDRDLMPQANTIRL